tara:strand:- start:645 stop:1793 length:1149 start_codon:yes stop_codon:yes gene_type:complete
MSDTFCILPYIHAVFNPYDVNEDYPDGTALSNIKPCCRYDGYEGHETFGTYKPIEDSELFKKVQEELSSGIKSKGCSRCWKDESVGEQSYRQGKNQEFKHLIEDGSYKEKKLRFLEITPSNVCNLACRTCNSGFSSRWLPVEKYLKEESSFGYYQKDFNWVYPDWRKIDLSHLTSLKLMGGEPMFLKDNVALLKHLDSIGQLEHMSLIVITNLMNPLTDDWKDLLGKCKEVMMYVSIDAIGELGEYIRTHSNWETVRNNLVSMLKFSYTHDRFHVQVNSVISIFNVNKTIELQKYIQTLVGHHFEDILRYPAHQDIRHLPNNIKEKLIDIGVTKKIEEHLFSSEPQDLLPYFFSEVKSVDKYHKKHFKDYNPEMWELLNGEV